MTGIKTWWL